MATTASIVVRAATARAVATELPAATVSHATTRFLDGTKNAPGTIATQRRIRIVIRLLEFGRPTVEGHSAQKLAVLLRSERERTEPATFLSDRVATLRLPTRTPEHADAGDTTALDLDLQLHE